MTDKRLFGIVKGHREHIVDHTGRLYSDNEVANLLNELAEENEQLKQYIRTLGIGISKIMQSIKDDREEKALIMCLVLLKKLEEEELLE